MVTKKVTAFGENLHFLTLDGMALKYLRTTFENIRNQIVEEDISKHNDGVNDIVIACETGVFLRIDKHRERSEHLSNDLLGNITPQCGKWTQ